MGRISSPCLNKVGYSMFWNSMWDDKHNFSKLLNEDEFLRVCIPLFFEDNLSNDLVLYLKKSKFLDLNLKKYSIFSKGYKNINLYKYFKSEKFYLFFSKIWILRYQGWIIIYIFLYIPVFNKFFTHKEKNLEYNLVYNDIFFNYYYNLNKLNYNNNYFKKSFFLKNEF
jgi:hypothetical protein